MRVKQERCHAKRKDSEPEVGYPSREHRQGHVKQHHERPHTKVDCGPGEAGEQDAERVAGGGESTTSRDVPSSTERQVGRNGM